uniref:Uncharacterized protein n=1 Tax=Uronema confervicola TaxID=764120 RepID=A0A6H1U5R9_9CHLO|nr:hypothetical protein [Uronema confervicola]QIZ74191.1 hypothetical protein [Uronema confervicola]
MFFLDYGYLKKNKKMYARFKHPCNNNNISSFRLQKKNSTEVLRPYFLMIQPHCSVVKTTALANDDSTDLNESVEEPSALVQQWLTFTCNLFQMEEMEELEFCFFGFLRNNFQENEELFISQFKVLNLVNKLYFFRVLDYLYKKSKLQNNLWEKEVIKIYLVNILEDLMGNLEEIYSLHRSELSEVPLRMIVHHLLELSIYEGDLGEKIIPFFAQKAMSNRLYGDFLFDFLNKLFNLSFLVDMKELFKKRQQYFLENLLSFKANESFVSRIASQIYIWYFSLLLNDKSQLVQYEQLLLSYSNRYKSIAFIETFLYSIGLSISFLFITFYEHFVAGLIAFTPSALSNQVLQPFLLANASNPVGEISTGHFFVEGIISVVPTFYCLKSFKHAKIKTKLFAVNKESGNEPNGESNNEPNGESNNEPNGVFQDSWNSLDSLDALESELQDSEITNIFETTNLSILTKAENDFVTEIERNKISSPIFFCVGDLTNLINCCESNQTANDPGYVCYNPSTQRFDEAGEKLIKSGITKDLIIQSMEQPFSITCLEYCVAPQTEVEIPILCGTPMESLKNQELTLIDIVGFELRNMVIRILEDKTSFNYVIRGEVLKIDPWDLLKTNRPKQSVLIKIKEDRLFEKFVINFLYTLTPSVRGTLSPVSSLYSYHFITEANKLHEFLFGIFDRESKVPLVKEFREILFELTRQRIKIVYDEEHSNKMLFIINNFETSPLSSSIIAKCDSGPAKVKNLSGCHGLPSRVSELFNLSTGDAPVIWLHRQLNLSLDSWLWNPRLFTETRNNQLVFSVNKTSIAKRLVLLLTNLGPQKISNFAGLAKYDLELEFFEEIKETQNVKNQDQIWSIFSRSVTYQDHFIPDPVSRLQNNLIIKRYTWLLQFILNDPQQDQDNSFNIVKHIKEYNLESTLSGVGCYQFSFFEVFLHKKLLTLLTFGVSPDDKSSTNSESQLLLTFWKAFSAPVQIFSDRKLSQNAKIYNSQLIPLLNSWRQNQRQRTQTSALQLADETLKIDQTITRLIGRLQYLTLSYLLVWWSLFREENQGQLFDIFSRLNRTNLENILENKVYLFTEKQPSNQSDYLLKKLDTEFVALNKLLGELRNVHLKKFVQQDYFLQINTIATKPLKVQTPLEKAILKQQDLLTYQVEWLDLLVERFAFEVKTNSKITAERLLGVAVFYEQVAKEIEAATPDNRSLNVSSEVLTTLNAKLGTPESQLLDAHLFDDVQCKLGKNLLLEQIFFQRSEFQNWNPHLFLFFDTRITNFMQKKSLFSINKKYGTKPAAGLITEKSLLKKGSARWANQKLKRE